jgi:hypothetical protein
MITSGAGGKRLGYEQPAEDITTTDQVLAASVPNSEREDIRLSLCLQGAYMSASHRISKMDLPGVSEDDFVCYPRRGDSLSFYSKLYDRRLALGKGWLKIAPDEAAKYMAERLGIEPKRPEDRRRHVSRRTRRVADWIYPLPGSGRAL